MRRQKDEDSLAYEKTTLSHVPPIAIHKHKSVHMQETAIMEVNASREAEAEPELATKTPFELDPDKYSDGVPKELATCSVKDDLHAGSC